jgi:hypothetical protein
MGVDEECRDGASGVAPSLQGAFVVMKLVAKCVGRVISRKNQWTGLAEVVRKRC